MLQKKENIVLRSLQILYLFALRGEKLPFSRQFQLKISTRNAKYIQNLQTSQGCIYFKTFRHQTLPFYYF